MKNNWILLTLFVSINVVLIADKLSFLYIKSYKLLQTVALDFICMLPKCISIWNKNLDTTITISSSLDS